MMLSFSQQDMVLVSGATGGIGQDVVRQLNALGVTVIAVGRNADKLEALKQSCTHSAEVFAECCDPLADLDAVPAWLGELAARYGRLSGLVCAAGMASADPLMLLDHAALQTMFDVNYCMPVLLARGFSDHRVNTGKGAAIVFVASLAAQFCWKGQTAYAGSKAALIASCKAMARELAPRGIRANCVSPSYVKTPILDVVPQRNLVQLEARLPFGLGEPDDVSHCVAYLLSRSAKWITGQNFIIDCGLI